MGTVYIEMLDTWHTTGPTGQPETRQEYPHERMAGSRRSEEDAQSAG